MSCVGRAPTTADEWFEIIDRCATAAGGASWHHSALLGLLVVALAGLAFLGIVATLGRIR